MAWQDALQDLLQRYTGAGAGTAAAPADPHGDYQQVARAAPPDVVASGLSQAFRSDQTPPFPQMLANLFGQSDPNQRAGVLNRLRNALEPGAASAGGAVTPQQASQVSPQQVQDMASQAERRNPSVIDEVSGFYAQHPQAVKAVGGLALTIALQHILKRR
jgi:hypothetical protein